MFKGLRFSFPLRITVKTYLFTLLLILIVFSLKFTPLSLIWKNLLIAWIVACGIELSLNAIRKKIVHLPDAALITATIITGLLATTTSTIFIVIAVAIALLSKHFIRFQGHHIFNPANFGILVSLFIFNQNIEWWIASNLWIIIIFGLFIMFKQKRIQQPLILLVTYFVLYFLTNLNISPQFIRNSLLGDFSLYFFAFIMVAEPQTAAWTAKGRAVTSVITAIIATIALLLTVKAPLTISLAVVNLLTPYINGITKLKRDEH